jgi:hypothetical protein
MTIIFAKWIEYVLNALQWTIRLCVPPCLCSSHNKLTFLFVIYSTARLAAEFIPRLNARKLKNNELEMTWKEAVVVYSRHYPDLCLERLRKATKISAKMLPPDRYLNLGSPEYKAVLLTRPDRRVTLLLKNENTADWGLFDLTSVSVTGVQTTIGNQLLEASRTMNKQAKWRKVRLK